MHNIDMLVMGAKARGRVDMDTLNRTTGVDRRALMRTGAAAMAVTAVSGAAQAAGAPQRLSLPTFMQDRELVGALRRGVDAMKALPPSDAKSWWWQGAVHHLKRANVPDFPTGKPMPTAADQKRYWDQCPHNLSEEGADEFLGWHAAYLLHFEEALRAVSGLDRLRVPYWDYTDPAQRKIPALFLAKTVRVNAAWEDDPVGVQKTNPLYERLRNPNLMDGVGELEADVVDVSWFTSVAQFRSLVASGPYGGHGFGGGDVPGQAGYLEIEPHGLVHDALGGGGLMSSTTSAAFDPIFWPHHANIDRLWRAWLAEPNRTWGAYGTKAELDAWLAKLAWPFRGVGGAEVLRPRGDDTLMSKTTVRYEGEAQPPPDPKPPAAPGAGPALAVSPQVRSFKTLAQVAKSSAPVVVSGRAPASVALSTTPVPSTGGGSTGVRPALARSTPTVPTRLLLDVSGLEVEGYGSYGYEVYVNLPAGATANRASPHFVGLLKLFGVAEPGGAAAGEHAGHGGGATGQTFDVSAAALAASTAQPVLTITFRPFDLIRRPAGEAAPTGSLKVGNVSLRVVEGSTAPVR